MKSKNKMTIKSSDHTTKRAICLSVFRVRADFLKASLAKQKKAQKSEVKYANYWKQCAPSVTGWGGHRAALLRSIKPRPSRWNTKFLVSQTCHYRCRRFTLSLEDNRIAICNTSSTSNQKLFKFQHDKSNQSRPSLCAHHLSLSYLQVCMDCRLETYFGYTTMWNYRLSYA